MPKGNLKVFSIFNVLETYIATVQPELLLCIGILIYIFKDAQYVYYLHVLQQAFLKKNMFTT